MPTKSFQQYIPLPQSFKENRDKLTNLEVENSSPKRALESAEVVQEVNNENPISSLLESSNLGGVFAAPPANLRRLQKTRKSPQQLNL